MEDLITLAIAVAIGLASMLAGQRNKNKKKTPKQQSEELDYIPPDELEKELSVETSSAAKGSPSSALDILGRILSGDLSDLTNQPKSQPKTLDSEYVDPMIAGRQRQLKRSAEQKARMEIDELKFTQKVRPPSPTSQALYNPTVLRQAIVVSELLDKPVSMRRRKRVG